MPPEHLRFHVATFGELDARTLYELLRLRIDVFVVEQECAFQDLDGRDTEPDARHLWLTDGQGPLAYLRVLAEPAGVARIGRVVVARRGRGDGYGGRLMTEALALVGHLPCVLGAQAHLADWYGRHGFAICGPGYLEDGIPHVPMRREPHPAGATPGSP